MENCDSKRGDFRNAMSRLGAAVSIVTSNGQGGRCGVTATAVCSVTDTPPTLLVCINRSSAMNAVFKANGKLCVNVLSAEQEGLARDFAGMTGISMEERFAQPCWAEPGHGQPMLEEALANLQGRIIRADELGTHTVMIVELDTIGVHAQGGDGLVYFSRVFHRVPAAAPVTENS